MPPCSITPEAAAPALGRRAGGTAEKHRMPAEFADDYNVRIGRRVARIGIRRVTRNLDEMPGNLPICCTVDCGYIAKLWSFARSLSPDRCSHPSLHRSRRTVT